MIITKDELGTNTIAVIIKSDFSLYNIAGRKNKKK